MEIVYFVLGIVTVLLVLGVVIIVRVGTLVKELKEEVQFLERGSSDVANDIHRRIDDVDAQMHSMVREIEVDLRSQLDSRIDKLTNQIIKQKDLLKG